MRSIGPERVNAEKKMLALEENPESGPSELIGEIIKLRQERGISQKKLEELSGVKQPVIARMESGITVPNLSTVLRVLTALGKTLYIGDLR